MLVLGLASRGLEDALTHDHIAAQDFFSVRKIVSDLAADLVHLHKNGRIHADVKPLNVVQEGPKWKLIDLDVSCKIGASFGSKAPSSGYCPPEMADVLLEMERRKEEKKEAEGWRQESEGVFLRRKGAQASKAEQEVADKAAAKMGATDQDTQSTATSALAAYCGSIAYDLWSLGVVLFWLVFGRPLWLTDQNDNLTMADLQKLKRLNARGLGDLLRAAAQRPKAEQQAAISLLRKLLEPDPARRLAYFAKTSSHSEAMAAVRQHPFFDPNAHQVMEGRLRRVDTDEAPQLDELSKGAFHVFLSHNWKYGQDQMRIVKSRLPEFLPSCRTFLDVDK